MNLEELTDEVEITLQDTSFNAKLVGWVNDAVDKIIDEANVPGFKSIITVDTVLSKAYANLPSDCSGRILYAGNSSKELEGGVVSLEELLEIYPGFADAGDVVHIAIEGSLMYYQYIPAVAQTITLLHRRKPTRMILDDDEPEGIPEHLHREVIVPKAAEIGFSLIEDGIEGEKVNTISQGITYRKGLYAVREWVAKRIPHRTRSIWSH